jgi:hypothetical protein
VLVLVHQGQLIGHGVGFIRRGRGRRSRSATPPIAPEITVIGSRGWPARSVKVTRRAAGDEQPPGHEHVRGEEEPLHVALGIVMKVFPSSCGSGGRVTRANQGIGRWWRRSCFHRTARRNAAGSSVWSRTYLHASDEDATVESADPDRGEQRGGPRVGEDRCVFGTFPLPRGSVLLVDHAPAGVEEGGAAAVRRLADPAVRRATVRA